MSKVIISLTTIHSRVEKIHHVITSLLTQNCNIPFEIKLFISKEGYLLDEGIPEIPEALRSLENDNNEKFSVNYTENIAP